MAYASTSSAHTGLNQGMAARILNALTQTLIRLAENNPSYRRLQEISQIPDEDLLKRGITREDLIRQALAGRIGL